jgi:hypothetical protein
VYMLRFDMRAPDIGASPVELYAAATEMCAWAEGHGCLPRCCANTTGLTTAISRRR